MFFESMLNAADLFEENRLLHLVLRAFGLRASDPEIYKQLIRALVPDDGSFPPYDENTVLDSRIGEAEREVRVTMPRRFIRPYLPDCAIAQAWECSADEYGNQAPCPPCASPDWDARCDRCTYCQGGLSMENIWDVMEDMSVRIAHLTAEVFRLTAGTYWDEYPLEAMDPASSLYDDLLFTTETCFPAYREMLRNRFHGQELMSSEEYRRYIRSMSRISSSFEVSFTSFVQIYCPSRMTVTRSASWKISSSR